MPVKTETSTVALRPPVIAVMGHIDHGKSTLLDYIRKANTVEKEAGGITQHISAYEVLHTSSSGESQRITFLDTPGHEAFQNLRARGATVADIAILVVAADDGVKPQTLEAYRAIKESNTPFVVAINKIDKPDADIERTKQSLAEHEIYLEGYGGNISWTAISAKTGQGVPELLDLLVLASELENLTGDAVLPADGVVLESSLDAKRGISATLIIKNGRLRTGSYIVAGESLAPVRLMEDFLGKAIREATFSSPVRIIGWNSLPPVGAPFQVFENKKEAESFAGSKKSDRQSAIPPKETAFIPIVIKADTAGSLEAIEHELGKIKNERLVIHLSNKGVGSISEGDVKLVANGLHSGIVIGFNVKIDASAAALALRDSVTVEVFSIIYKLSEWLENTLKERTPKIDVEEATGSAKVIKIFSQVKDKQIIGGKVIRGSLSVGQMVKIIRREYVIGTGKLKGLQSAKKDVKEVPESSEFGALVQSAFQITGGDVIEAFTVVRK